MTSRERVRKATNHQVADRIPFDLGSYVATGIHASIYTKLRKALGLRNRPAKVIEPYQMLADVEMDVINRLGIDTVGLWLPTTFFGFRNENWKSWRLFDGTRVLIPEKFITTEDAEGNIYLYPQGDTSVFPSGRMPKGGYYFDAIVRQQRIDKINLDPKEWVAQQYPVFSEEELRYLENVAKALYEGTDLSILGGFLYTASFGDIGQVPGVAIRHPKGIRDPILWYMAHIEHSDYIKGIFELQCGIALKNLELSYQAVGNKIDVIVLSGADFGAQDGPFISPDMYREFYKPFHKRVNDWVHQNTSWKTFYHTCGSVVAFLADFVEAGLDILNPVQVSAAEMNTGKLKREFGEDLTFWGGGVDTQHTLPRGTPQQVKDEVKQRIEDLAPGGGFIFAAVHNIQRDVPPENIMAMWEALQDHGVY